MSGEKKYLSDVGLCAGWERQFRAAERMQRNLIALSLMTGEPTEKTQERFVAAVAGGATYEGIRYWLMEGQSAERAFAIGTMQKSEETPMDALKRRLSGTEITAREGLEEAQRLIADVRGGGTAFAYDKAILDIVQGVDLIATHVCKPEPPPVDPADSIIANADAQELAAIIRAHIAVAKRPYERRMPDAPSEHEKQYHRGALTTFDDLLLLLDCLEGKFA